MSSLRRIALPILAVAAVVLVAGCGGGASSSSSSTSETTTEASSTASERPPLDPAKTYTATMKTSEGTFSFTLDVKDSPNTTASFASLVKKGFYDGLTFHRIVPDFVIQGGDPKGDGTGGPGYTCRRHAAQSTPSTRRASSRWPRRAPSHPGTSGSQFFVVTGADAGLPPDYAILGNVNHGLDVVEKIGQARGREKARCRRRRSRSTR